MKYTRENAINQVTVCPYCGDDKTRAQSWVGCCGESSAHWEESFEFEDGEIRLESELEIENEILTEAIAVKVERMWGTNGRKKDRAVSFS